MFGEIMTTLEKVAWVCKYGKDVLKREYRPTNLLTAHKNAYVEYHPLGVIGVLAPWNYPFHNMYNHIVSGLFAGTLGLALVLREWACFCTWLHLHPLSSLPMSLQFVCFFVAAAVCCCCCCLFIGLHLLSLSRCR